MTQSAGAHEVLPVKVRRASGENVNGDHAAARTANHNDCGLLRNGYTARMDEITFTVSPCEESGVLVASWDEAGGGGITTQGVSMEELRENVREAVACHFEEGEAPSRIILHFAGDIVLQPA